MSIEILDVQTTGDGDVIPQSRMATIAVSNELATYLWHVGGLPLAGNLQALLDARDAELFLVASQKGHIFDVYDVSEKEVLKALTLVFIDELNILRALNGLPNRTANQIKTKAKNKLRSLR